MLIIGKKQFDVFSKYMLKQFEDRMMGHLRSEFTEETSGMKDEELRLFIQNGIQSAESHDVTDETDVERYLDCMMRHGEDFDTNPRTSWAGEILGRQGISGTEKMNQIDEYELFAQPGD